MKSSRWSPFVFLLLPFTPACSADAQTIDALPACEWCGASEAPANLVSSIRIAPASEPGERLVLSGVVYYNDGRTPAPHVVVYAYQTDASGVYPRQASQPGNGRRHGALRGWLRTDSAGHYRIETIKPGPYPGRPDPMHIHMTVTPPGGVEAWIDEVEFEGDPRLTPAMRARSEGRGGPGIITLRDSGGTLVGKRDIVLDVAAPSPRAASAGRIDTLRIDPIRSVINWKGTKFQGLGSHAGVVRLSGGALYRCTTGICGGHFDINMTTIEVTDIPASDPVPRRRLNDHLHSADFFAVDRYPRARFRLERVGKRSPASPSTFAVLGALTISDSTRQISFDATTRPCGASTCIDAAVAIDRQLWGITYRFDPVRNLLVDDTITLGVHLVVPDVDAASL